MHQYQYPSLNIESFQSQLMAQAMIPLVGGQKYTAPSPNERTGSRDGVYQRRDAGGVCATLRMTIGSVLLCNRSNEWGRYSKEYPMHRCAGDVEWTRVEESKAPCWVECHSQAAGRLSELMESRWYGQSLSGDTFGGSQI